MIQIRTTSRGSGRCFRKSQATPWGYPETVERRTCHRPIGEELKTRQYNSDCITQTSLWVVHIKESQLTISHDPDSVPGFSHLEEDLARIKEDQSRFGQEVANLKRKTKRLERPHGRPTSTYTEESGGKRRKVPKVADCAPAPSNWAGRLRSSKRPTPPQTPSTPPKVSRNYSPTLGKGLTKGRSLFQGRVNNGQFGQINSILADNSRSTTRASGSKQPPSQEVAETYHTPPRTRGISRYTRRSLSDLSRGEWSEPDLESIKPLEITDGQVDASDSTLTDD